MKLHETSLCLRAFRAGPDLDPPGRRSQVRDSRLISMLMISMLVKSGRIGNLMTDNNDKPGHVARRFQQIAVGIFHAEVEEAGYNVTPVQYAALTSIRTHPGIDQATLAGLIAYDRTTITGVVDRLVQKGLAVRQANSRDRRVRELQITDEGRRVLGGIEPAVEAAQRIMLRGLTASEAGEFLRLLRKAIAAGNELSRAPLREAATEVASK